jgi:sulfur carrier protein ThiS
MHVTVQAFNEVRHLTRALPPGGALEVIPGATAGDVLARLGVPPARQATLVLFRNGRPARLDTTLEDGDALVVLAPMTGG